MQKNNNIFWEIIAVIIFSACFLVSWKMILPDFQEKKTSVLKLDQEISAASAKLDSLNAAESTITGLGNIVDQMFIAVPSDKDTANVITELEAIAGKNNTYIPSIQVADAKSATSATAADPTATTTQNNAVSISFTVNGSFTDLTNFIKSIENNVKFFNIKSMTMSASSKTMSLALQIEAYKQTGTTLSSTVSTTTSANNSLEAAQ